MGIFSRRARLIAEASALTASASVVPQVARQGIRTPFGTSGVLNPFVFNDLYGSTTSGPVTRGDAMSVPAVAKGVGLVVNSLSSCPLKKFEGDVEVPADPWMFKTDSAVAPKYRMGFILEDLVLHGWAVVLVTRDSDGSILVADHLQRHMWTFDDLGQVIVGDEPLRPDQYILIKGPHDGLLNIGARTIRAAISLEQAWIRVVKNPLPATVIKQVNDDVLDDDEIDALLTGWRAARQDPDGAVAYVPNGIDIVALGSTVADTLVEARNAVTVDIARLVGVPASALDAGAVQSSLTYNNTNVGLGFVLVQQGLTPYADAINAAFSQDNVVPPGQRVALDMTDLLADAANISRTGTPTQD